MTPAPSTITRMTPPCSLRLDLGVLDDFLVFRHLVANVGRELFTARPDRIEAERVQALLHVRQRQHFGDLRLQLVGKIGRQTLRPPQSVPGYECETFHAGLLHGRNGGRRGRALEAGEAERLGLAALRRRPKNNRGHCWTRSWADSTCLSSYSGSCVSNTVPPRILDRGWSWPAQFEMPTSKPALPGAD